ncbi:MAG: hypothetical protein R3E56_12680 [Burkholderiaceae bacterium]
MGVTFEEELTRTLDGFRAQLSSPLPNAVFGSFSLKASFAATAAIEAAQANSRHRITKW